MSVQRGLGALFLVCAVIVLLSIIGLVGDFATGLDFTLDGLLLLLVSLMMGGIFTLMLLVILKDVVGLKLPAFRRKKSLVEAPASNPADPTSRKGTQAS